MKFILFILIFTSTSLMAEPIILYKSTIKVERISRNLFGVEFHEKFDSIGIFETKKEAVLSSEKYCNAFDGYYREKIKCEYEITEISR